MEKRNHRLWMAALGLGLMVLGVVHANGPRPMDAREVKLLPGSVFYARQELHREGYLAQLEPDKLLFHYRELAGLPQPEGVTGYGGWDSGFIRGHMAGHYLSAASRMAVATGDERYRERVNYMVAELAKCQEALGLGGYLAAFPTGEFDVVEGKQGNSAGIAVPYYTIHKIMAGLLDAHDYLGNDQALEIAAKMADYFETRLAGLSEDEIERMLRTDGSRNPGNEFGAMSDALARLYRATGDGRHLSMARIFNRQWLIEPLAAGEDRLTGLHGNTHIQQVMGIAHVANLTGDETQARAARNFWRMIVGDRTFVIGGNSFHEWLDRPGVETGPSIDDNRRLPDTTAESCNTQNLLKLTAYLFENDHDAKYADFIERALTNHLLATVAPDSGAMTYFLPLHGHFRTYLDGTHCCVGSGSENTPRYNEWIYFQDRDSLYANLYIPSQVEWRAGGLTLRQEGDPARGEPVRFTIVGSEGDERALCLRIPHWITGAASVELNGEPVETEARPSSYVTLRRRWTEGDVVTLTLPAGLRLERARDDESMVAFFHGPVLLAGELGSEGMPNDFADKDAYLGMPPVEVPEIVANTADPGDWMELLDGSGLAYRVRAAGPARGIVLRPLYDVHHQRYSVYWKLNQPSSENEER